MYLRFAVFLYLSQLEIVEKCGVEEKAICIRMGENGGAMVQLKYMREENATAHAKACCRVCVLLICCRVCFILGC